MKKIILINFFLFFTCFCHAQQTMNLSSVFENIEKNNPLLQSYVNRIEADKAMVGSANTWMSPRVGVEFDMNPYSFDNFYTGM